MRLALYNPVAGGSWFGGRLHRACRHLERMTDVRLVETVRGNIAAQTRRLLTSDITEVFACGGDGTVSDVAAGLIDTDIPLCIVPCGTTNVLAREFRIPLDPVQAIEALSRSSASRLLRTWAIGDRHLVLGAGIGWDARLMHRAPAALKRRFGTVGLAMLALPLALSYEFPLLTVTGIDADDRPVVVTGTSALICNTRYWSGGNPAIRAANPADDLLEVVVLEKAAVSHLLAFWSLMMLPRGDPLALDGTRMIQVRSLTVTSTAPQLVEVHVNGDPAGHLPIAVQPAGSVRIRVAAVSNAH